MSKKTVMSVVAVLTVGLSIVIAACSSTPGSSSSSSSTGGSTSSAAAWSLTGTWKLSTADNYSPKYSVNLQTNFIHSLTNANTNISLGTYNQAVDDQCTLVFDSTNLSWTLIEYTGEIPVSEQIIDSNGTSTSNYSVSNTVTNTQTFSYTVDTAAKTITLNGTTIMNYSVDALGNLTLQQGNSFFYTNSTFNKQ